MASLPAFLDLLVARVVATTPEVDPAVPFKHQPDSVNASRQDRDFRVVPRVVLEVQPINSGDPVTAHLELEVDYSHRTNELAGLQLAAQDVETLFQRIAYYPGGQWASADGYEVTIPRPPTVSPAGGGGLTITIAVDVLYNMRS